ncbi:MAG: macro domain-containing protein [Lachnospiraceae bacterium]|nr:macro domain-containing protein [Lachnospiraceae bacterium]
MAFRIIRNDITKVKADAIVNTANPNVAIGSGVDSAIYEAAGAVKLLQARQKIGRLEIGQVGITPAFGLDAKYIIHSSGPYWIDGAHQEEEMLRKCYDGALQLAHKHRCKSIAFPLMSTGTYGFPHETGLQIALEAFNSFLLQHEMEIILVVFGETAFKLSGQIFDDVQEYVDNSYVKEKLDAEYYPGGVCQGSQILSASRTAALDDVRREECLEEDIDFCPRSSSASRPMMVREKSAPTVSLDSYLNENTGSLGEYLQQLINKKGKKNSEVYTAANMTKQYFSKLLKNQVAPSKTKMLSLAVALKLNMDETIDFLRMSGYAFSPLSQTDKVFAYFISKGIYDIYRIDIVLFDYGLPTVVND